MKYEVVPVYLQPGNISRFEWLDFCSNNKIPIFVQQLDNKMNDFIKIKVAVESIFQTDGE